MSQTSTVRRPTHCLHAVTKKEGAEKGYWTAIGAAWPHQDGKGFSLKLDLVPVNGADIVLRLIEEKPEAGTPGEDAYPPM